MAHGDDIARAFDGHNARHARAGQHVALGGLALHDERKRGGVHGDEALGHGHALGVGLLRHVHHAHVAVLVDMGELLFGHGVLLWLDITG